MEIVINDMEKDHWDHVLKIYLDGIATGIATFQTQAPAWEEWDRGHMSTCRLVAAVEKEIVGWAALSPTSSRSVYAGVAEVSVYVNNQNRGVGIGKALLDALVKTSEENGLWTLQAGIFPENIASLTLHKQMGFREVGIRERIGKMGDVWRDVVLLERRSNVQGID